MIFEDFLEGIETYEEYDADLKTQAAVERKLLIVGEAVYKARRKGISLPSADQLINRRNTMAHQYDQYNSDTIWTSIHRELPGLKEEVDRLLEEY